MMFKFRKAMSTLLAVVMLFSMITCLSGVTVAATDGEVGSAIIDISQQSLADAVTLTSPFHIGVNLEMSMISDEMWVDNGHWMEQSFANSGIEIMRWGYDAWVFDWENEEPLLNNYQGGNNTKDDEGSYGLREFLYFCKENDIIPLVDIPIESYDHRASSAETTGAESLANVKRLAKNMATYLNESGFDEVYFDMGNEPYSSVSCQYGGIPATTYGALFPAFYEIIKGVNSNYKLILVHQEGATAWNNSAEAAANGYYDGVDDHQYPRPNGWANYYARNDDDIFSNGFGGTTPDDKIKIMGECNLPWPNFPAYGTNLGSSLALLNGFLDLANMIIIPV